MTTVLKTAAEIKNTIKSNKPTGGVSRTELVRDGVNTQIFGVAQLMDGLHVIDGSKNFIKVLETDQIVLQDA
jgi:hypothetical protein